MGSDRASGARTGISRENGAALVEFAVLLPLLIMVVLGIVEFGFALSQELDVRHGAREATRMIATDDYDLVTACNRMNLASGATITLAGAGAGVGGEATVTVQAPLQTITGFFDSWLPAGLNAQAKSRIEQDPTSWSNGVGTCI